MEGKDLSGTVVVGASGQLGTSLLTHDSADDHNMSALPRDLRLEGTTSLTKYLLGQKPQWIINAAAMTNVDLAQDQPERAFQVNALGPGNLSRVASEVGANLIHISSEAVYSGERTEPYTEDEACHPVSVYGISKLSGDELVMVWNPNSFVIRTSWLYSSQSGSNFPTRILNQLRNTSRQIQVVTDIYGNPTPTTLLADAIFAIMGSPPAFGTYHICAREAASKYDWAVEIAEHAGFGRDRIEPVLSNDYETTARRPKHVDLDCSKFVATGLMQLPTWKESWSEFCST